MEGCASQNTGLCLEEDGEVQLKWFYVWDGPLWCQKEAPLWT